MCHSFYGDAEVSAVQGLGGPRVMPWVVMLGDALLPQEPSSSAASAGEGRSGHYLQPREEGWGLG